MISSHSRLPLLFCNVLVQTVKFRRITLATLMAVSCIAVGAAFICYNENWSPVKGIYWTIVTTTVSAMQCIVESSS
jgi:hypothetical protein